jgi:DNA-binding NtrC family response regulator
MGLLQEESAAIEMSPSIPGSNVSAVPRRCFVWVWDENPLRRKMILDALRELQCVYPDELLPSRDSTLSVGSGIVFALSDGAATSSELKFIGELREKLPFVICVTTGHGESDLAVSCQLLLAGATHIVDVRAHDFLFQLRRQVQQAAERVLASEAEEETLRALMSAAGFAGRSSAIFSLFRTLCGVSSMTDLPVLITGETGTGKELIAAAIHSLDSKRSRQPFVSINCAALPDQLSESELFGHQKGAFTGAERERSGLFRSAEQGVLFLDEVGELSSSLQSKLLRVLQTGRLRSVGSDREVAINVRVIAATNRRLDQMVQGGNFREDLFHRLNVLSLHIPPLRERTIDIEPLVLHFVKKYHAVWEQKGHPTIGDDFLQGLENLTLPGNARQLENLVRRALVEWEGNSPLSLRHLPPEIWQELSAAAGTPTQAEVSPERGSASGVSLELHAVQYLQRHDWNLLGAIRYLESVLVHGALAAAGGNQSEAARLLGITPRSVYNKLHKYYPS